MYNINNNSTARFVRAFSATLLLLSLNFMAAFGQQTLCEILADISPSNTTIDVAVTTNNLPNHTIPTIKIAKNRLVWVTGKVTVTNPVVIFDNCDIRMFNKVDEEAEFVVPSGTTLIFKNCRIAAGNCEKLWKRIDVRGGRLQIIEGTIVEDAKTVVNSEVGGSKITVTDNTFNRNYTGIFLLARAGQKTSVYNIGFNTIKQEGQPAIPFSDAIQRGIFVENVKGINLTGNFENLNNGIGVSNSVANISGATFKNMNFLAGVKNRDQFALTGFLDGNGILSRASSICNISSCEFDNCAFAGFASNFGTLKCQNSNFNNVNQFGILLPLLQGDNKCLIDNNNFNSENATETVFFVDVESKVAANGIVISNNGFVLNDNNSSAKSYACVYVNGHKVNNYKIIGNTFTGKFPKVASGIASAIWTFGGVDCKIARNIIDVSKNAGEARGIIVSDGNEFCTIENNMLNSTLNKGIDILNSKHTLLCSNTISNAQQGIIISGDCANSNIYSSSISNSTQASIVFTGNNSGIKTQRHHGNRFLVGSAEAFHDGNDFQSSQFFVNDQTGTTCSNSEFMPSSVFPPNDWFVPSAGCTTLCAFSGLTNDDGVDEVTELDADIMGGRLANYAYTEAEIWNANFNLYGRILSNPTLSNNADVNAYVNTMGNSNFATFYNVLNGIATTMNDENYSNQVNELMARRDVALQNLMTALQQCVENEDNIELENAYDQMLIQYNAVQEMLDVYIQNHNASRNALLDAVLNQNEAIETTSVTEANLKTINSLRIKFYKNIELSDLEWNVVEQIAQICTKYGGLPTNLARVLVSNRESNAQTACSAIQGKVSVTPKRNDLTTFYPNPASSELSINYKTSISNNSDIIVKIYDLSGRLVVNKALNLNELNTINISGLHEGFYLINLYEDSRLVVVDKFVKSN